MIICLSENEKKYIRKSGVAFTVLSHTHTQNRVVDSLVEMRKRYRLTMNNGRFLVKLCGSLLLLFLYQMVLGSDFGLNIFIDLYLCSLKAR